MFCTIRELARETNLSYPYIRELIETGKIPHLKSGTRFLIPKTEAIKALEELSHQPDQE